MNNDNNKIFWKLTNYSILIKFSVFINRWEKKTEYQIRIGIIIFQRSK